MGDMLKYFIKNKNIYIESVEGQYKFPINENIIGNIDKILELMAIDDDNLGNKKTELGLNHALIYMLQFHERSIALCIEACHNDLKKTLLLIKQTLLS